MIRAAIFLMIIIFCVNVALTAQDNYMKRIDSLKNVLTNPKSADSVKAETNLYIADVYLKLDDSVKAREYIAAGYGIYKKTSNARGMAMATGLEGQQYLGANDWNGAIGKFTEVLELLKDDTSQAALKINIKAKANIGLAYGRLGQPQKELEISIGFLPDLEKIGNKAMLGVAYGNIAAKFINLSQYAKANNYIRNAIQYLKEANAVEYLPGVYCNAAICMNKMDSLDEMKMILQEWKKVNEAELVDRQWKNNYYIYEGVYHTRVKEYGKAMVALNESEKGCLNAKDTFQLYNVYIAKTNLYNAQQQYGNEKKYLLLLNKMALADSHTTYQISTLKDLSDVERKLNNTSAAFEYLQKYTQLKDSLDESALKLSMSEIETRYQTQKKENDVLVLKKTSTEQQLQLQKNKNTLMLIVGCGILISITLFLLFIIQKRKSRIAKQQELLYQQQIKDMEQQKQLEAAKAMVEGQEQERERLARDLHDGLGGLIAGTKMFLSNLAIKSADSIQKEQLNSSIEKMDHTLQELRHISRNMMPQSLSRYGLKAALKDLCESLEISGTKITFQENGLKNDMASATQITIYRVIQELLTNALKHAKAKIILVQVLQDDTAVHITIEDDGRGFDQQNQAKVIGIGLLNVKNRVAFLKGKLDISSKENIGTTVTVELSVA